MFDSFNSNSNSKNGRRSFFRFGSESKNSDIEKSVKKPSVSHMMDNPMSNTRPSKAKTDTPDIPSRSPNRKVHNKRQAPLEKGPLRNTNPFLSAGSTSKESLQSSKIKEVPIDNSKGDEELPKNKVIRQNTNPFTTNANSNLKSSIIKRSRPPPPPVNMNSITIPISNTTLKKEISMNNNDSESNDITPLSSCNQHRRQRSEAEKLVDHIEDYINERKVDSGSSISLNTSNDSDVEISQDVVPADAMAGSILRDVSIESSLSYVKPLIVDSDTPNVQTKTKVVELGTQLTSNLDDGNDTFSFTTSASGKSTRSLQQVAKDESNGFKSAHFDFAYKSNDPIGSDESVGNTRRHLRITNEVDSSSSNKEEQDDSQDNYFGDEKSNNSTKYGNDRDFSMKNDVPTQEPELTSHRRVFRIVNEDRPSFYLNSTEDTGSLIEGHSLDTTTSSGEYDVPLNISNQSELSISKSSNSSALAALNSNGNPKFSNKTSELNSLNSISESLIPVTHSLSEHTILSEEAAGLPSLPPTTPNEKSTKGSGLTTVASNKSEKSVPLVSSYVEELRLKYYKTSNFLQAPPNLPVALKQKNNLIQPKNIKVKLRTSSKQIGIKHGKVKQKLLALETRNEDSSEKSNGAGLKNKINVDHTKEFHKLLGKESEVDSALKGEDPDIDQTEDYLKDIPGDEAYNSDDIMAPLREKRGQTDSTDSVSRSNTVVSYYTRSQNRMRSGTLDNDYVNRQKLPTHIPLQDYQDSNAKDDVTRQDSVSTTDSDTADLTYSLDHGLHVANPDSDTE